MKAMEKKPSVSHWNSRHGLPCIARSQTAHVQHKQIGQILRNNTIQAKLSIGQANDKYEQEADRVAEQVMSMPEPKTQRQEVSRNNVSKERTGLQRSIVTVDIQRMCPECEEELQREPMEEEEALQTKSLADQITPLVQRQQEPQQEEELLQNKSELNATPEVSPEIESAIQLLPNGGQPMPKTLRSFMEPHFGADFSGVHLHTDAHAHKLARATKAQAFTVGSNIVFGTGHYAPGTERGRRLLAHELTHVVQQGAQRSSPASARIQRLGDLTRRPASLDARCPVPPGSPGIPSEIFEFGRNVRLLASPDRARITNVVINWHATGGTAAVRVDGFASDRGGDKHNWELSCARAEAVVAELEYPSDGSAGIPGTFITIFAHGETDEFGSVERNRLVTLTISGGIPPIPKCGPEVADWYARQVTAATTDVAVLGIRADIAAADAIARANGTTAHEVAEGGAAAAVVAQQLSMSSSGTPAPPPTPAAATEIAVGTIAGLTATRALASHPIDAVRIGILINRAANNWRALVNHGARYDFKAHTMRSPTTTNCPDTGCRNSVTICHGAGVGPGASNCYLTDLPGNFFYAQIGRFAGWSERTLQLGSQLAQLTGTGTWDTPQDTAAIHLGFSLPIPMTSADLCSVLPGARSRLNSRANCEDCSEPTTAPIR